MYLNFEDSKMIFISDEKINEANENCSKWNFFQLIIINSNVSSFLDNVSDKIEEQFKGINGTAYRIMTVKE